MDNFTLNISFWFYLIALPWLGLVGAKLIPFNKSRIISYLSIISFFIVISVIGISFSNQALQVAIMAIVLYMFSEIVWHSKRLRNKFLRILMPAFWVLCIYLFAFILFAAAGAGGRLFPPSKKVSNYSKNLIRYDVIEKQYADCGTSTKNYILYKGVRFLPFHREVDILYHLRSSLIEVDSVSWHIDNGIIGATLFSEGSSLGPLVNRQNLN